MKKLLCLMLVGAVFGNPGESTKNESITVTSTWYKDGKYDQEKKQEYSYNLEISGKETSEINFSFDMTTKQGKEFQSDGDFYLFSEINTNVNPTLYEYNYLSYINNKLENGTVIFKKKETQRRGKNHEIEIKCTQFNTKLIGTGTATFELYEDSKQKLGFTLPTDFPCIAFKDLVKQLITFNNGLCAKNQGSKKNETGSIIFKLTTVKQNNKK